MAWEPGRNKEGKEEASRMLPAQPQVGDFLCHIWGVPHTRDYGIMDCMGYRIMGRMNHVIHTGLPNDGLNSRKPQAEINSFSLLYDRCFSLRD